MKRSRTQQLAEHLLYFSKTNAFLGPGPEMLRSTPYLSQVLGIRNVPDAVRKLRKKGHVIETTRRDVHVSGLSYADVAVYKYIKGPKV